MFRLSCSSLHLHKFQPPFLELSPLLIYFSPSSPCSWFLDELMISAIFCVNSFVWKVRKLFGDLHNWVHALLISWSWWVKHKFGLYICQYLVITYACWGLVFLFLLIVSCGLVSKVFLSWVGVWLCPSYLNHQLSCLESSLVVLLVSCVILSWWGVSPSKW